jgi:hypothetical protein
VRLQSILRTWDSATPEERRAGQLWYHDAHHIALSLSVFRQVPIETVAGVIAALSPQTSWADNVEATRAAFDGRWNTPQLKAQYGANREKARRIIEGEAPRLVLGGWKVKAFYALIRDGGNPWDVCVDGHAVNVVLGKLRPGGDAPTLRAHVAYETFARAYRGAAEHIGVQAHEVQAVTWLVQRRRLDEADRRHAWQRRSA